MGKHILSLRIPEVANEGIFIIEDTSIYDSLIPVSCMNLQILPPGYSSPTSITPTVTGFRLVLNACTLGIIGPTNCYNGCPNITDGVYNISYSVAPNDSVYVQYNYLRTTGAIIRLNTMLCQLNMQCCLPSREEEYQLKELDIIRNFLLSAKINVENNCGDIKDGVNQYKYAVQLMDKLSRRKPFC